MTDARQSSAYGGNWGWWTPGIEQHDHAFRFTNSYTKVLGLERSSDGTWQRATTHDDRFRFQQIVADHAPEGQSFHASCSGSRHTNYIERHSEAWGNYRGNYTKDLKKQNPSFVAFRMLRRACWLRCISFAAVSVRLPMVPLGTGYLDTLRAAVANDAPVMSHCVKISGPSSCHSWEFWEQGDFYSGYQIQVFFFRVRQTIGFSTGPATHRIGWKFDREENIQAASHIFLNLIKVFYVRGDFLLPWLARAIQEDSSLPDLPEYPFVEGQLYIDSNIPADIISLATRELVSTSTHAMHL